MAAIGTDLRAGLQASGHPARLLAGVVALAITVALATGCTSLVGSMASGTLSGTVSAAFLDQDDPILVEQGAPAYLLLVDGLIARNPDNRSLLAAGAQLYALYGSRFAESPERAVVLTGKARRYGERAMCVRHEWACSTVGTDYDTFVEHLSDVTRRDVSALYAYAVSWLSYLDATSSDWTAVAELPWVEAALERVLELDEGWAQGGAHAFLGTLKSLRPPALGGQPAQAQHHFERAIELSDGRDLGIKVDYARRYARLVFDQELHDRLLNDVLAAPVEAPGFTLFNVLAKQEAQRLLESSEEYF